MTKLYQRYVISLYLKNFFIIFCALEFFYALVDFVTNYSSLPDSANLQLLYFLFNLMSAVNYMLPLSIVFAMIASKFTMIRSNELLCMYSVGITKNSLIFPIFLTAIFLIFVYISLNFTQFSYAYEYRSNLLEYSQIMRSSSNLFLKYQNKYVYFGELNPLQQTVENVKIFNIKGNELTETIKAKSGVFKDNVWLFYDVERIIKPEVVDDFSTSIKVEKMDSFATLEQFRPKVIENAYFGTQSLSIPDMIDAIKFFGSQGININQTKANLYLLLFFPFFAPFIVVIFYYYLPLSGRFLNLAFMGFVFICATLVGWGILFTLGKLSANALMSPEMAIILPIIVLGVFMTYLYRKNSTA